MKPPCDKNCEGRNAECHKYCEKYKAFEDFNKERRDAKLKENDRYSDPKRSKKHQRIRLGIK